MDLTNLHALSATDAARVIREGVISSEQYVAACLARVRETDARIEAWAFLDPDHALAQARAADQYRLSGQAIGPLHGVPIGIKDIIDTADMPTENGSPLHAGRTPSRDAAVVTLLRAAGAVIMGKTITTEFACGASGKTRNPHDPAYSPGGSSSGSAAAVAAGMVPLALGSQTGGSTVRPASYCGVYGLKPTRGLIPRRGMSRVAQTLDTVGLFARTLDDIALLLETCVAYDEGEFESSPRAHAPYRAVAAEEPPIPPTFGFVRTPHWDRVDADAKEAFAEIVERLGARVEEVELAGGIEQAWEPLGLGHAVLVARDLVGTAVHADRARARAPGRALPRGARADSSAQQRVQRAVRAEIRCAAHACRHRCGAGRRGLHRRSGVLLPVDDVRVPGAQRAVDERGERLAARRPAGRPAPRRRPAAAHGAVAGRHASTAGVDSPTSPSSSTPSCPKGGWPCRCMSTTAKDAKKK